MYLFKGKNRNPRPGKYTFIIIPGKYGSSKSISFPRWLIFFFAAVNFIIFLFILAAAVNYYNVKHENAINKDAIKKLESVNKAQQKEIGELKQNTTEIKDALKKIKNLENKLKERLSIESSDKSSSSSFLNTENVDELLRTADIEIDRISSSLEIMDKRSAQLKFIPTIFPCNGILTSYFGGRNDPISRGHVENHKGIDISNSYGTKIHAAADGTVIHAGWYYGYGKLIMIDHGNGYVTLYGHNSKLLIEEGQHIKKGQVISLMGSTGRSTGSHVHFEIRKDGVSVNPLKVIKGGL